MFRLIEYFFLGAALLWLAPVVALLLAQRRLIYRPMVAPTDPAQAGFAWMRAVRVGDQLLGWWGPPPQTDGAVLVFLHGNRGTLARAAGKAGPWARAHGMGLFCATYRGFEGNSGQPCETGLYRDARAALDWLATQGVPPYRLFLHGESLGGAVALQLALERPVARLVLEAPFISVPAMARHRYPFVPTRLVWDRFDNLRKIGLCRVPMLILHGDADRTTPVEHTRQLAQAAPPGTRIAILPGGGHLDLYEHGALPLLDSFLSEGLAAGPLHEG